MKLTTDAIKAIQMEDEIVLLSEWNTFVKGDTANPRALHTAFNEVWHNGNNNLVQDTIRIMKIRAGEYQTNMGQEVEVTFN